MHHWTQITSYLSASGVNSLKKVKEEKGKQWVNNNLKVKEIKKINKHYGNLSNSKTWKQSASTNEPVKHSRQTFKTPKVKQVTELWTAISKLIFQFKFQIYIHVCVYLVTMKNVANQCWSESDRSNIRESNIIKGRYVEPARFAFKLNDQSWVSNASWWHAMNKNNWILRYVWKGLKEFLLKNTIPQEMVSQRTRQKKS